jgi:ParB-like chromosome segregation protein Spo0J
MLLTAGKPLSTKAAPGKTARVIKAVDTSFIKAAGETRILTEETAAIAAAITPGHKTLLKAVAQGRDWAKALIAGEVISAEDISVRTGLSAAHVARGLKCMSIPPGVVERLVAGKGSSELTWAAVRRFDSPAAIALLAAVGQNQTK